MIRVAGLLCALIASGCGCGGGGPAGGSGVAEPVATPPDAASSADAAPELGVPFGDGSVDARLVNQPGELVPLDQIVRPGRVTVLDFWADWCGACKLMEEKLLRELAGVPGVVVRKLDIVDDISDVAVHYQVGRSLPEMWIFDRNGERVHQLLGGAVANAAALATELTKTQ